MVLVNVAPSTSRGPPVAVSRGAKRLTLGLVPKAARCFGVLAVSRRVSRSISTKSMPKANRRAERRREEPGYCPPGLKQAVGGLAIFT